MDYLRAYLEQTGLPHLAVESIVVGGAMIAVIVLSFLTNFVAKKIILNWVKKGAARTRTKWDDQLIKWKVFHRLAHIAPALVIYWSAPLVLKGYDRWMEVVIRASEIYLILVGVLVVDAGLNSGLAIYRTFRVSKQVPLKSFIQVSKIIVYFLGGILTLSIVLGQTPVYFLGGMGALTAVLMLVFKDPILGFVAGIQLTSNKMVSVGDWVEMPKFGADGDVLEISLTTVKVQNWDKTITMIPTYALISDSFKNWKGMSESGGRRIKRAIHIDLQTIRICTEEMLTRYQKIAFISDYLQGKTKELEVYNRQLNVDLAALANGRRLTNVGTFRAYVIAYLRHHPMINQEMTFLVRQLAPTRAGLPLEIYVFSADKVWANYEAIQADIFDHFLAIIREFDLRTFQDPTGNDFQSLRSAVEK